MGRLIGVFGASGFAREVMPLVRVQLAEHEPDAELVYVDRKQGKPLNGTPTMSEEAFFSDDREQGFTIAIADATIRQKVHEAALHLGAEPIEVRARSAEVLGAVCIDEGAILCSKTVLTSNIKIGRSFHLNIYSYVANDCVIGDFVTFAQQVACNGHVVVEDNAYIGTGAVIRQGTPSKPIVIGKGAVVGMGAVVTKSVSPGNVVVGNPARQLQQG